MKYLMYVQFNLQKSFEGFANLQPDTGRYRELGVNKSRLVIPG